MIVWKIRQESDGFSKEIAAVVESTLWQDSPFEAWFTPCRIEGHVGIDASIFGANALQSCYLAMCYVADALIEISMNSKLYDVNSGKEISEDDVRESLIRYNDIEA